MAANRDPRSSGPDATGKGPALEQRLLWNQENVKDVAESIGVANLGDEPLRTLSQDVEYRIGQILVEALRFMRLAKRTTMTVQDISQALRVLDVEPLYGYNSTRPLRYGEASLGSQPLFYLDDEEIEFEKMINAPLPKIPRDIHFTSHWLALDGAQPVIVQNPTTSESRSQDLLPKGPGANPALAALSGQDNPHFRPAVKHVVTREQILYFEKIQAGLMDDGEDIEVQRLREAVLESVRSEPGIHQLSPYFVNFIADQVTHHLENIFVLRQMMELTNALINNEHMFLESYATILCAVVLTCMLGRKIGSENGVVALRDQYQLREFAATLVGQLSGKYSEHNKFLRPKLVRTCLKYFLGPSFPPSVWYGAVSGLSSAGGKDVVKMLLLPHLKEFESVMLIPLREKGDEISRVEFEALVGAIIKAIQPLAGDDYPMMNGMNGYTSDNEAAQIKAFLGEIIGERIVQLGDHRLNQVVLDARNFTGGGSSS
ncbi:histone H4-like TAF Taf6, SAGA complex subunit [Parahypoxylon ruwenzoriense]